MTDPRAAVDQAVQTVEEALQDLARLEREIGRRPGLRPDDAPQKRLAELGEECARLRAQCAAAGESLRRKGEEEARQREEMQSLRSRLGSIEAELRSRLDQSAAEAELRRREAEASREVARAANEECDALAAENGVLRARLQAVQGEPFYQASVAIENELRERERAAKATLEREQRRRVALESELAAKERERSALEQKHAEAVRQLEKLRAAPPPPPSVADPPELDAALEALIAPLEKARLGLQALAQSSKGKSLQAMLNGLATVQDHLRSLREYFRAAPAPADEDPARVLDLVLRAWAPALKRRSIAVHRQISPLGRRRLQPERLRVALYQLVKNSYEAMPKGGRLDVALAEDGEWLVFRLSDSGPGFPSTVIEEPARPFHHRGPGHLGLGLALASRIASRAGGSLSVQNDKDGGARMELRLPGTLKA